MLNDPDLQPNATINRWIQGIMLFDFELVHVPAEDFKGPDGLSRRPTALTDAPDEEDDSDLDAMYLLVYAGPFSRTSLNDVRLPYAQATLPSVFNAAHPHPNDGTLEEIYAYLKTGIPPSPQTAPQRKRFIKRSLQYFLKDARLWKRNGLDIPLRVILTPSRRLEILMRAHEEAGHRGKLSTLNLICKHFFWPYL
jgi:hypothetical protein